MMITFSCLRSSLVAVIATGCSAIVRNNKAYSTILYGFKFTNMTLHGVQTVLKYINDTMKHLSSFCCLLQMIVFYTDE